MLSGSLILWPELLLFINEIWGLLCWNAVLFHLCFPLVLWRCNFLRIGRLSSVYSEEKWKQVKQRSSTLESSTRHENCSCTMVVPKYFCWTPSTCSWAIFPWWMPIGLCWMWESRQWGIFRRWQLKCCSLADQHFVQICSVKAGGLGWAKWSSWHNFSFLSQPLSCMMSLVKNSNCLLRTVFTISYAISAAARG